METLRYIAISFISGLTAIIPGVSGGTIFAIFGLSEPLAEDINGLVEGVFGNITSSFTKLFKSVIKYGKLPIIIGLGSLFSSLFYAKALVSFGASIEYFLRFLFIGLVVFSLPTLWVETKCTTSSNKHPIKYLYVIIGFIIALLLFNANDAVIDVQATDYNSFSFIIKFFLISLVAGVTAILPGISGTNILIIGGVFEDYILFSSQIGNYPLQYATYLLAAIIGSIIAAKCFTLLFKYFRQGFFSIMTGLTASTIVFIWITPLNLFQGIQSICGFFIAYMLIKVLNEQEIKVKANKY